MLATLEWAAEHPQALARHRQTTRVIEGSRAAREARRYRDQAAHESISAQAGAEVGSDGCVFFAVFALEPLGLIEDLCFFPVEFFLGDDTTIQ